jgi:hypothetical protein
MMLIEIVNNFWKMPVNKDRTMEECLKLALPYLVKGQTLPTEIQDPPNRIKDHPKAILINQILDKSMEIQTSTIPETAFNDFVMANAGLAVHGFLKLYFKSLGITENVELVYGGILTEEAKKGNIRIKPQDFGEDVIPNVWIEFDGTIINNTYVYRDPQESNQVLAQLGVDHWAKVLTIFLRISISKRIIFISLAFR